MKSEGIILDLFILEERTNLPKWVYELTLNTYQIVFFSFLPKSYWQKKGLFLLLDHPSVIYQHLPETYIINKPILKKEELLQLFDPMESARQIENLNNNWLSIYVNNTLNLEINIGINPFRDEEFVKKLIISEIRILNHSSSNDIGSRLIMPIKNILKSVLDFPDKFEKVKEIFHKLQIDFFCSYEIQQLLFLLKGYKFIRESINYPINDKLCNFYDTMVKCRDINLENFNREIIHETINIVESFYKQYKIVKNE